MDKRDVFLKCGIVEPLPYLLDGGAHIRDKLEKSAKNYVPKVSEIECGRNEEHFN